MLRLILIGERFPHTFRSSEIIGDNMYQYTEEFCEILQKKQKNQVRQVSRIIRKTRIKIWKIEKSREKNVDIIYGEKALR